MMRQSLCFGAVAEIKCLPADYLGNVCESTIKVRYPSCSCGDDSIQGSVSIKPKKVKGGNIRLFIFSSSLLLFLSQQLTLTHLSLIILRNPHSSDFVSPSRNCRSSLKALCPTLRPVKRVPLFLQVHLFSSSPLYISFSPKNKNKPRGK